MLDTKEEIWRDIHNFSKYEISNYGNVRNKKTQKVLKTFRSGGYFSICLTNDSGIIKGCRINRLVALTFLPNPENKRTVNHKDHNSLNNNLNNLEWMTTVEQNLHRRERKKKDMHEFAFPIGIWKIDRKTNEKLELFKSSRFAAKWIFEKKLSSITEFKNGANSITWQINKVVRGKGKTAFGYMWKYEEKYFDEEWRNIPSELINSVEGYKISNYGRIQNHRGRITNGSKNPSGYLFASAISKSYSLHRLVAKVFSPNPDNKKQVNHLDGDKTNASFSNLEWCSQSHNIRHAHDNGLQPNTRSIIQYDKGMNKINEFKSQTEASKMLGISGPNISNCCRGKRKTAGGFIFKFTG